MMALNGLERLITVTPLEEILELLALVYHEKLTGDEESYAQQPVRCSAAAYDLRLREHPPASWWYG